MTDKQHTYVTRIKWPADDSGPTRNYKSYSRTHRIMITGKPDLMASSDPGFRGDASQHNPEDLLVASLSSCHMLWYLHLCAVNGIAVHTYEDRAEGTMQETPDGGGRFTQVTLNPVVQMLPAEKQTLAHTLHQQAHTKCFIANSVNFPVSHIPTITCASLSPNH